MGNEITISYYDFAIESAIENRKIKEMLTGYNMARIVNENSGDDVLLEANLIQTLVQFIKKIFDKVVQFFQKVINFFTGKDQFVQDRTLIRDCENKLKNMSREQTQNLSIPDIYKPWNENFEKLQDYKNSILNSLDKFVNELVDVSNGIKKEETLNIEKFQAEIDELKTVEDIFGNDQNIQYKDVDYNTLLEILDSYKKSRENSGQNIDAFNNIKKQIKDCRKKVDKIDQKNENFDAGNVYKYKNIIYTATDFLLKYAEKLTKIATYNFQNKEAVLKRFVSMKLS